MESLSVNEFRVKLQNFVRRILRRRVNEVKNLVRECVSKRKLCQAVNERFRYKLSLNKTGNCQTRNPEKPIFKGLSNGLALSNYETLSNRSKTKTF